MEGDGSWKPELRLSGRDRQNCISRERLSLPRWEMKRQCLREGRKGAEGALRGARPAPVRVVQRWTEAPRGGSSAQLRQGQGQGGGMAAGEASQAAETVRGH